jgi:deoxyadenosine/deoxycytidine kinase
MNYLEDQLDHIYWNDDVEVPITRHGQYVSISGNTGAGKSTLVKAIRDKLTLSNQKVIGINERVLHHPLLKLMFGFPQEYSFIIQLNFAIQRYAILYRWLSLGYTVVIERSHLDDPLFVKNHFQMGHISLNEYESYKNLTGILSNKLPEPDIYVFLSASPSLSMTRLKISEKLGERPEEFPDENVKSSFVEAWYEAFEEHFKKLVAEQQKGVRFKATKFLKWGAETETDFIANEVIKLL